MSRAEQTTPAVTSTGARRRHTSRWWRTIRRRPLGVVALIYLVVVILACTAAPVLAPYDPNVQDLMHTFGAPSGTHLLGTDYLGRDILSRLLFGGRPAFLGVLIALVTTFSIGIPLGLIAGYAGGITDRLVTAAADIALSIPGLVIILLVLAVVSNSTPVAMITLGVLAAPGLTRVVRSVTLAVREELYIAAARVTGLTQTQILRRHVLPRISGPLIVQGALLAATALLVQTGLGFLGLGMHAPNPTWGSMVADASQAIFQARWQIIPAGAVIGLTIVSFGLVGDALRDSVVEASLGTVQGSAGRRRRRALVTTIRPREADTPHAGSSTPSEDVDQTAATLLRVRGLSVGLRSADVTIPVVQDVSFHVSRGDTVGIVGESGCGKTVTALSLLGGLSGALEVSAGEAWFEEHQLLGLSRREWGLVRGSRIAYVSQEPMSALDPLFTVESQLSEAVRRHTGATRRAARERVTELLRMVRLPDAETVAKRYPFELSGGMAQRVAIAFALAGAPQLLIADEPTTALDVTVQAEILRLLRTIQQETQMALLIVTHDWGVVADICDRVAVMYAGEVVEQGLVSQLFQRPLHPYTHGLLASNPHLAQEGEDLPAIAGAVPPPGAWPAGCHFAPRCEFAAAECVEGAIPLLRVGDGSRVTRCVRVQELRSRPLAGAVR